jgi:hypothetical protein
VLKEPWVRQKVEVDLEHDWVEDFYWEVLWVYLHAHGSLGLLLEEICSEDVTGQLLGVSEADFAIGEGQSEVGDLLAEEARVVGSEFAVSWDVLKEASLVDEVAARGEQQDFFFWAQHGSHEGVAWLYVAEIKQGFLLLRKPADCAQMLFISMRVFLLAMLAYNPPLPLPHLFNFPLPSKSLLFIGFGWLNLSCSFLQFFLVQS